MYVKSHCFIFVLFSINYLFKFICFVLWIFSTYLKLRFWFGINGIFQNPDIRKSVKIDFFARNIFVLVIILNIYMLINFFHIHRFFTLYLIYSNFLIFNRVAIFGCRLFIDFMFTEICQYLCNTKNCIYQIETWVLSNIGAISFVISLNVSDICF